MKNYTENCDQQNTFYYICSECYDVVRVDYQNTFAITNGSDLEKDTSKTIRFNAPSLSVFCKNCDNFMFKCDEKLINPIIKFNKLQFFTTNCCEGHFVGVQFSNPYIQFDASLSQYEIESIATCFNDAIVDCMEKLRKSIDHKELFDILDEKKMAIAYMYQNSIMVTEDIYNILWLEYNYTTAKKIFDSIKEVFAEICMTTAMYLEEKVSET